MTFLELLNKLPERNISFKRDGKKYRLTEEDGAVRLLRYSYMLKQWSAIEPPIPGLLDEVVKAHDEVNKESTQEASEEKKIHWAYRFQCALTAIHTIRETQIAEGAGNYSRDLYPFRAIVDAMLDKNISDEAAADRIKAQLEKHKEYDKRLLSDVPEKAKEEKSDSYLLDALLEVQNHYTHFLHMSSSIRTIVDTAIERAKEEK